MNWARSKAWCAAALAALAINGCRLGYDLLGLPSTSDGGVATNGGDAGTGLPPFGGSSGSLGGVTGTDDGGAPATEVGGVGGAVAVGGIGGSSGAASSGTGGTDAGGSSGGADGGPGVCVPDAACSCEVFQGHDYRFCGVLATRVAGATACQSANMVLAHVDSAEENAWLLQQLIDHGMFLGGGSPIVILDGNDIQSEGMWRWEDGTLFWDGAPVDNVYTNWASAPKSVQGDCLGMTSDGKWADRACSSGNATVACESP